MFLKYTHTHKSWFFRLSRSSALSRDLHRHIFFLSTFCIEACCSYRQIFDAKRTGLAGPWTDELVAKGVSVKLVCIFIGLASLKPMSWAQHPLSCFWGRILHRVQHWIQESKARYCWMLLKHERKTRRDVFRPQPRLRRLGLQVICGQLPCQNR